MEEINDSDLEFSAVYDPETLKVTQIGQTCFLDTDVNIIPVDMDLALKVLTGKIQLTKCFANLEKFEVEVIQQHSLEKLEDVLHRIPDIQYSKHEHYDLICTIKKNTIVFELSSELGGTYKQSQIKKKIVWNANTTLHFMLTDYNDPHIIYYTFSFALHDLLEKPKIFSEIKFPKQYSIFTDRLFKSYAIKNENNRI